MNVPAKHFTTLLVVRQGLHKGKMKAIGKFVQHKKWAEKMKRSRTWSGTLVVTRSGVEWSGIRFLGLDLFTSMSSEKSFLVVASLLLVAMPGAPSSVLAPSSDARSP